MKMPGFHERPWLVVKVKNAANHCRSRSPTRACIKQEWAKLSPLIDLEAIQVPPG
jgi:hypothetical protein